MHGMFNVWEQEHSIIHARLGDSWILWYSWAPVTEKHAYPVVYSLGIHDVLAVIFLLVMSCLQGSCVQIGPGFQGCSQTEVCAGMDMAEHHIHPNTADAVSQGFGPFQKPVGWQLDALHVCHLDQMAQGA